MNTLSEDSLRMLGDDEADKLIEQLVEDKGIDFLRNNIVYFSDYKDFTFDDFPFYIKDFLYKNSQYPVFYNPKQIVRACQFYQKNQQTIGLVLGLYALPYCYLGANGAKVLYFSERIKNDTYKRLLETGNFVKAVLNFDAWQQQKIFAICLKVRLLHASIRLFIKHSKRWDLAWGIPINQEDMLGTNLAFSLIVLRGLKKLGYSLDKTDEDAFLETWQIIGLLLGIKAEFMPKSYKEMWLLERQIASREFRTSMEGQALTASLIKAIRTIAPNQILADVLQQQAVFLLGKNHAKMLAIKETNIPIALLKVYNTSSRVLSKWF